MIEVRVNFRYYILIFFGLVLISGCSLLSSNIAGEEENWEDEVLLARECGESGLACCATEPVCFYGQECCTDPNDSERSMCSDDCGCGGEGDYCCAGDNVCDEGLACDFGNCAQCGGLAEPCCVGKNCTGELVCYKNQCMECGQPGTPCCGEQEICEGSDKTDSTRTECRKGVCIYCGTGGKIACDKEPYCAPGNLLNNGFCHKCGGMNQPCCKTGTGVDYQCDPAFEYVCALGFCTKP